MNKKKIIIIASVILSIFLIVGAIYILNHKKQEDFGRKFNNMNEAYKKVLFATGQNQTESAALMLDYNTAWSDFYTNYKTNAISPYSSDLKWQASLDSINNIVIFSTDLIDGDNLRDAHLELEKVRQIWQETFKRNDVTMLGFYLTEYHDLMEKAIEQADTKDIVALKDTCNSMKIAWDNVEQTPVNFKEADTLDYNNKIAANLENINKLCSAVDNSDLEGIKDASSKLKGLFIPLYLKYG